ncbi:MAG: hypothetical protein HY796_12725 [Elusimicrobia bacterium]|nr:hypothetical protein [Elusimicrobiota bacterium]
MKVNRKTLSAAILGAAFTLPTAAAGQAIDFDRGTDMNAVGETVRDGASAEKWPFVMVGNSLRATRDCKFFAFRAGDLLVSPPALLQSSVYRTVCEQYAGKEHCYDELVRTEKRNVTVTLRGNRTMLPWERDVFNVCLKDTAVTVEVDEASHRYKIGKKAGPDTYEVQAVAAGKLTTEPDWAGISVASWNISAQSGGLELALKDKWAAVYGKGKDEKTLIKVTLKMAKAHWFDPVILEKEFLLSPADVYSMDFSKYALEFRQPLEFGQKYFAQWGFKRKGKLSKESFINGGETERIFLPLP